MSSSLPAGRSCTSSTRGGAKGTPSGRSVFERILKWELERINLIVVRKSLSELLSETKPRTRTKGGEPYDFDEEELRGVAKALPRYLHEEIKLPLYIYRDLSTDEFYVEAEVEKELLRNLCSTARERGGRLWIPKHVALRLLRKFKTTMLTFYLP